MVVGAGHEPSDSDSRTQMATHHITIAKAAFTAACLRPDVTQLTRDSVSNFHDMLQTVVSNCSPSNVQKCKQWILEHIIPSSHRSTALGKYLTSFSRNIQPDVTQAITSKRQGSVDRKRLHLLYVLHDALHHGRYHNSTPTSNIETYSEGLTSHLSTLFELAREGATRAVSRRLDQLLDIWTKEQYFHEQVVPQLRQGKPSQKQVLLTPTVQLRSEKELPYIMPATHGDPSAPYYDLPAANLMPHIVPNRSAPMRADQIRALQLSAGPADEGLVNTVKDFLKDVKRIDNLYQTLEDEDIVADMDELGQLSYRNEADEVVGDTYYGWSRDFCGRMKKRAKGESSNGGPGRSRSYSRSRSRSSSRSRSRSLSLSKRRRYSSRSPQPGRRHYHSRSQSRSPDRRPPAFQQDNPPSRPSQHIHPLTPASTWLSIPYPAIPLEPAGVPLLLPPPPPPNYTGPWPPPPPSLPLGYGGQSAAHMAPTPQFYQGSAGLPSSNHKNNRH